MKREIVRYSLIAILLMIVLVFVYPTLYRYDKYNEKIPVRINRITGEASMLSVNGWEKAEETVPKQSEMDVFKSQVESEINSDKDQIKNQLKLEIEKEILSDLDKQINEYKQNQLDPNNSFTQGSTMDDVKKIMGTPTSIQDESFVNMIIWYYGASSITFKNQKVTSWNQSPLGSKLKVR